MAKKKNSFFLKVAPFSHFLSIAYLESHDLRAGIQGNQKIIGLGSHSFFSWKAGNPRKSIPQDPPNDPVVATKMDPINQRRGVHGLGQVQARRPARLKYILPLVECAFAHQNVEDMEKQLKARPAGLKLGWSWVCRCPARPGPARPMNTPKPEDRLSGIGYGSKILDGLLIMVWVLVWQWIQVKSDLSSGPNVQWSETQMTKCHHHRLQLWLSTEASFGILTWSENKWG